MPHQSTAALPFFSGQGQVRELLRNHDWSKSALGEPDLWPSSLRTIVALTLNTPTPIFFCWGPDLNFLYNDAYIEILGGKHPAALGQPFRDVWTEVWNDVEPLVARTLDGEALYLENMPFTITRKDFAEQIWVSFSYSPLHDEAGAVVGLFCALNETTRRILVERERNEETERLRRLFQQSPSMIAVVRGPEHIYEIANNAYLQLVGRGDVVGRRVRDAVPELGSQGFISLLDEVYKTGEPHIGRAVPIWLDKGSGTGRAEYFIDFIYQPIFGPDGDVTGIFGEGIDVTETVKALAALRASELHLLSLFEQTAAGIAEIDLSGRITRVNDRYCKIVQRNSTELLGMFMQDLTHPDDLENNLPLFQNLVEKGTPFSIEKRYLRPDGSSIWVNTTVSPIRAPNNVRPESVLAIVLDISEQKLAERALQEETRILELLNRSGQALASTLDLSLLLQTVTDSGRALTGAEFGAFFYNGNDENGDAYMLYTLSGAPREAFEQFGHPRATAVFKPTFIGEPPIRSDDITKDPRYGKMPPHSGMPKGHLPVRSYLAASVVSRTGEVIGGLFFGHSQVGVFTERAERLVTGLASQAAMAIDNARLYDLAQKAADERQALLANERTARAEAERLSRSKDEFLAMLAHELRNPLAPVSAAAEILRLASNDPERVQQVSEIISRQITHFTRLIDDLMDVSRVTRGLIQLEAKPVDLKTIISTAIEQVRPMIEARQHSLTTRMDAEHAVVNGDRTRLVQVIANLLTNAAKYTPPHGDITLKIEADREHARIVVSDNGNGMDGSLLPHVFDLFTQGSRGLDRSQGGLGIGLALVKAIVNLHQGEVDAFSAGIGKGSTFTVSIPLIRFEIPSTQEVEKDKEAHDLSILVVDDNVDAANALAILLKAVGHRVKVSTNGIDAINISGIHSFDVFILDIGLPDMTGYDLAMALRRRLVLEGKTYIALTGYGQPQDRLLSEEAGFAHHFVKPVNNQQLLKVLADTKPTSLRA